MLPLAKVCRLFVRAGRLFIQICSYFVPRHKLRGQESRTAEVLVFVRTSPFRQCAQYSCSLAVLLRRPTSDTVAIVAAAVSGLRDIYLLGVQSAKAGVMLIKIQPETLLQKLLDSDAVAATRDRSPLMQVLDAINGRWGRRTMHSQPPGR